MPVHHDSHDLLNTQDNYPAFSNYAHHAQPNRTEQDGFKLVIMGSVGVGKTSLVKRYTENKFSITTAATTGAFFVSHKTDFHGTRVKLQIWDTAGQERFRSMAPIYYRGANAAIIMYDLTRPETFDDVRLWLEELQKNTDFPELSIYIVGSKADLQGQRRITSDRARQSLHKWFPPPKKTIPAPPPAPINQNTFTSYIRPRFTSFTSAYNPSSGSSSGSANKPNGAVLGRSNTTTAPATSPKRRDGTRHNSIHSIDALTQGNGTRPKTHQRDKSWAPGSRPVSSHGAFSFPNLLNAAGKPEWDVTSGIDSEEEEEEAEWGLGRHMWLFEVSAKDCQGIQELFQTVIGHLLEKRHVIEAARRERERDSVMLHHPSWGPLAEEEEIKQKQVWRGCC